MSKRLKHLPASLAASAVLFLVAVLVGGLTRGGAGAAGAGAGVALVVASYVLSSVAVAWADLVNPQFVMVVALTTYTVKFSVLGAGMIALAGTGWPGLVPMAL